MCVKRKFFNLKNLDVFLISLGKKCSNTEFFLVRICCIWTEYGDLILRTRKNSVFGHFSRSVWLKDLRQPVLNR